MLLLQIAHEMRGTITLAHAAPQRDAADDDGPGQGGGGSASELIADIGEMVNRVSLALEFRVEV